MTMETQNGFFTQLAPLLAQRAVLITVSKLEEGSQLQVNICPRQLKDGENQALTAPLCVTGTAEDLRTVGSLRAHVHQGMSEIAGQLDTMLTKAGRKFRFEEEHAA
jgi:PRTRC genetic system protein E